MDFHLKTYEKVRDDKVLVNLCGKLTNSKGLTICGE